MVLNDALPLLMQQSTLVLVVLTALWSRGWWGAPQPLLLWLGTLPPDQNFFVLGCFYSPPDLLVFVFLTALS